MFDDNELKMMYCDRRLSCRKIARELGLEDKAACTIRRRLSLICVMRTKSAAAKIGMKDRRIDVDVIELASLRKQGWSVDKIARKFGVKRGAVRGRLIELGLPTNGGAPSGEKHGNWKGGRWTDKRGYVHVLCKGHKRASKQGYVLEHVLVWERECGPLPEGWVVHHLNGVKADNRPENLKGLPKKRHDTLSLLHAVQERVRQLEKELVKV